MVYVWFMFDFKFGFVFGFWFGLVCEFGFGLSSYLGLSLRLGLFYVCFMFGLCLVYVWFRFEPCGILRSGDILIFAYSYFTIY